MEKIASGVFVALLALTTTAYAQEIPASFDQLRVVVKPGDSVTVTDTAGNEIRGTILALSSSSLELAVRDVPRMFTESDVRTIRQQRHASFGTGATWGFVAGAGFGALTGAMPIFEVTGGERVATVLTLAGIYGSMGAGIGVGISALIRKSHVVYASPTAASAMPTVSPILAGDRKGLLLTFDF